MKALKTGIREGTPATGGRTENCPLCICLSWAAPRPLLWPPCPLSPLSTEKRPTRFTVWSSCSVCHEEKAGSTGSHEMTGHVCDSGIQAITDDSREGSQAVFAKMTNAHFLQYRHSTSIDTPPTDTKWSMYKVAHWNTDYSTSEKTIEMCFCRGLAGKWCTPL